ncbi:hypothetical protein QTP88_016110 [Uroleucon formosanum]
MFSGSRCYVDAWSPAIARVTPLRPRTFRRSDDDKKMVACEFRIMVRDEIQVEREQNTGRSN